MTAQAGYALKIVTRDQLTERLVPLRKGHTVVFTNGCFDLLHQGHVDLLERAAALGSILVVGLNTDDSVTGLKGPTRPVIPFAARAAVLAGLGCVDFVTGFSEPTPLKLIRAVAPDVLVKGGDWPVDAMVGADEVLARGGKVKSLPLLAGHSTTSAIARILAIQVTETPGKP